MNSQLIDWVYDGEIPETLECLIFPIEIDKEEEDDNETE
jgi:hypothetical protein